MLTARQRRMMHFIQGYTAAYGVSPSYKEIGRHLGLKSLSNVARYVDCLEERGFIRRKRFKDRAIEVVQPFRGRAFWAVEDGDLREAPGMQAEPVARAAE